MVNKHATLVLVAVSVNFLGNHRSGDYPKTHSLRELLGALGQSYDPLVVDLLEETYIGSRCLPVRYAGETARRGVAEVERLMGEMTCLS